jgi:hypothetical protein
VRLSRMIRWQFAVGLRGEDVGASKQRMQPFPDNSCSISNWSAAESLLQCRSVVLKFHVGKELHGTALNSVRKVHPPERGCAGGDRPLFPCESVASVRITDYRQLRDNGRRIYCTY